MKILKVSGTVVVVSWLLIAMSMLLVNAQDEVTIQNTDGIDEIVVVGTDSFIYVYDYTGQQVYKSPEGGWSNVATGDFNNDGDKEIVAYGGNNLKIYDPQVVGTPYSFAVTYGGSGGSFTKIGTGNLIGGDSGAEFALLRSIGNGRGRIIVYNPPNTAPVLDVEFLTDWRDFSIGDYDGDGDDDFALVYWKSSNPSGFRNLFELRKGHDPNVLLEDASNASVTSDSEWFDVATGDFKTDNGDKVEWVGSQNLGDNVIAQRWNNKSILKLWGRTDPFNFLATADFRNENNDQVVMLRNVSSGVSIRFVNRDGLKWADLSNLGTGWLNLAAGNVDEDSTFREAVIIRNNLIRVYRLAQSTADNMNCNPASECTEISGSFNGALAVGDLGIDFEQIVPFGVSITNLSQVFMEDEVTPDSEFSIFGDSNFQSSIDWGATILPSISAQAFKEEVAQNQNLQFTVSPSGLSFESDAQVQTVPTVPWMALSNYTGTTPSTVTVIFSDTTSGAELEEPGGYEATILIYRDDVSDVEEKFRYIDVTVLVGSDAIYLPLVIK